MSAKTFDTKTPVNHADDASLAVNAVRVKLAMLYGSFSSHAKDNDGGGTSAEEWEGLALTVHEMLGQLRTIDDACQELWGAYKASQKGGA